MAVPVKSLEIDLSSIEKNLKLTLYARRPETLFFEEDASEMNEANHQLKEGCYYDYELSNALFSLKSSFDQIVQPHSSHRCLGALAPNIYVGTLALEILRDNLKVGEVLVEVQSAKTGYREDYRNMLTFITEKCTDLLLQSSSPVSHHFDVDHSRDYKTRYQRFAFIKSIITSDEFTESIHRIVTSPATRWAEMSEYKDVRQARRFSGSGVKELVKGINRSHLPQTHHLRECGIDTLPTRISSIQKVDSVDTPENRFVKHALEVFVKFCTDIREASTKDSRLFEESNQVIGQLEKDLHHTFFQDVSRPVTLKLNSPVLQRKEGYREVLRVWLMFDLAAKLIWTGGEDVYRGGKKDVAMLYEYWLFFVLLDLLEDLFEIEPQGIESLIQETRDGLNLRLKQGKFIPLSGTYNSGNRNLRIRFSYNRSFSGGKNYPDSGSWTTTMRPDYTLSIWPEGLEEEVAEREELIVHIHFDAKYKIGNLGDILSQDQTKDTKEDFGLIEEFDLDGFSWGVISETLLKNNFAVYDRKKRLKLKSLFWEEISELDDFKNESFNDLVENIQQSILNEEKTDNRRGLYKNADLLKMHAYKDAIRRTGGSYVLYPGGKLMRRKGFHEIVPGLGAFPVRPAKTDNGVAELRKFIQEVLQHFENRASQRERVSLKTYQVYKDKPLGDLKEFLPEPYGHNRSMIPDETYVLVAYCKGEGHLNWILNSELYNTRIQNHRGSIKLGPGESGAKYILLHTEGEAKRSTRLIKTDGEGPRIFSKAKLKEKGYPTEPTQDFYLVYRVKELEEVEFEGKTWDVTKLSGYRPGRKSALPFAVTLTELMQKALNRDE